MNDGRFPIRMTVRVLGRSRHFRSLVYRDPKLARRQISFIRNRARGSFRPSSYRSLHPALARP
ncbi:MAG: hypothetical protein HY340_00525 [Candidatus Kerfeldbacteria bacterium]|nr:hypothetical protein [Candidatus Kerfeldbacteria bacterium]